MFFLFAPVAALSESELSKLLQERHPKKDWVKLLHILKQEGIKKESVSGPGTSFKDSVLAYATPGCKQKQRYEDPYHPSTSGGSLRSSSHCLSVDDDIVIIPLQDSKDLNEEEHVAHIIS